jgi:uncharacterized protein (TIGR01244 family)
MFSFLRPKTTTKDKAMNIRKISDDFSTTGQITPDDVAALAAAGFKGIVCARPDDEEPGQPSFDTVARAAKAAGIDIVHIPVSGMLGESQVIRFHDAWEKMPKPVLGYCRSGARAGSLYQTLDR